MRARKLDLRFSHAFHPIYRLIDSHGFVFMARSRVKRAIENRRSALIAALKRSNRSPSPSDGFAKNGEYQASNGCAWNIADNFHLRAPRSISSPE